MADQELVTFRDNEEISFSPKETDFTDGKDETDGIAASKKEDLTYAGKEIQILNEHENTSQGILEVAGLQQTVNIAVFFVKADLTVNYLYYITATTIVVSIIAQIVLSCLVAAKIWIRKCVKEKKTGEGNEVDKEYLEAKQRRLRKLDFITLMLVLFITILTTILLATSGMINVNVEED